MQATCALKRLGRTASTSSSSWSRVMTQSRFLPSSSFHPFQLRLSSSAAAVSITNDNEESSSTTTATTLLVKAAVQKILLETTTTTTSQRPQETTLSLEETNNLDDDELSLRLQSFEVSEKERKKDFYIDYCLSKKVYFQRGCLLCFSPPSWSIMLLTYLP